MHGVFSLFILEAHGLTGSNLMKFYFVLINPSFLCPKTVTKGRVLERFQNAIHIKITS